MVFILVFSSSFVVSQMGKEIKDKIHEFEFQIFRAEFGEAWVTFCFIRIYVCVRV